MLPKFLTIFRTLWSLKIKSMRYNLKLSIWDGLKTGPKGTLSPTVEKKQILQIHKPMVSINWALNKNKKNIKSLLVKCHPFSRYNSWKGQQLNFLIRSSNQELLYKIAFLHLWWSLVANVLANIVWRSFLEN